MRSALKNRSTLVISALVCLGLLFAYNKSKLANQEHKEPGRGTDQIASRNLAAPKGSVSETLAYQRSDKSRPSKTPEDRLSLAFNNQYGGEDILQREANVDIAQRIDPARYKHIVQIIRNGLRDVDSENLEKMPLEEISEIYHRYVNTLQFFCPRKDMLGGVGWGWYVCTGFSSTANCLIYLLTDKDKEDASLTNDIDHVCNCDRKRIRTGDIRKELQSMEGETPLTNALAQKEKVDVLLIEGIESDDVITRLLKRNALRHVNQLSVVFDAVNMTTSVSNYARQILLLKALHTEGFRIFSFERNPKRIFRDNPWRTGGYTLNMMRERAVDDPMVIPQPNQIAKMSVHQMANTYQSFSLTTEVLCKEILRVGDIDDGGWDVCMDEKYRPESPCLVYSFGIKDDWSFDDRMSSRFGCEVHSFDPSIGLKDHRRSKLQWFYNLGLSNQKGTITKNRQKWNMMNLKSIRTLLGHDNRRIDIIKMDIEESEWLALPDMVSTGVLKDVKQLFIEFHSNTNQAPISKLTANLAVMRQLYDQGFRLFWSHPNQVSYNIYKSKHNGRHASSCYELYYVNTNL